MQTLQNASRTCGGTRVKGTRCPGGTKMEFVVVCESDGNGWNDRRMAVMTVCVHIYMHTDTRISICMIPCLFTCNGENRLFGLGGGTKTGKKSFHCRHGKAYLFNMVVNVHEGPKEDRLMTTGLHTVADIHCKSCMQIVGWKYVRPCRRTHTHTHTHTCEHCVINTNSLISASQRQ